MPKRKPFALRLCNSYSVPGKTECREFLWSEGRECRLCFMEACHRRGMKAKEARANATERWESKQKGDGDA